MDPKMEKTSIEQNSTAPLRSFVQVRLVEIPDTKEKTA